jgi:flagellar basal-body rod protein FlgB
MGLFDLTDLVVQQALSGSSLRQQLLTNNLANADTPGFKASDVDFQSALSQALSTNDPGAALKNLSFTPVTTTGATQADGNNVDLNQQMSELTQNAVEYETLTELEKTRMQALQSAIGGT